MRIDPVRAQHQRDIARRFIQQRQQQMLEVDLIVTARETVVRREQSRLPAGRIQFGDQGIEGRAHVVRSGSRFYRYLQ